MNVPTLQNLHLDFPAKGLAFKDQSTGELSPDLLWHRQIKNRQILVCQRSLLDGDVRTLYDVPFSSWTDSETEKRMLVFIALRSKGPATPLQTAFI